MSRRPHDFRMTLYLLTPDTGMQFETTAAS